MLGNRWIGRRRLPLDLVNFIMRHADPCFSYRSWQIATFRGYDVNITKIPDGFKRFEPWCIPGHRTHWHKDYIDIMLEEGDLTVYVCRTRWAWRRHLKAFSSMYKREAELWAKQN